MLSKWAIKLLVIVCVALAAIVAMQTIWLDNTQTASTAVQQQLNSVQQQLELQQQHIEALQQQVSELEKSRVSTNINKAADAIVNSWGALVKSLDGELEGAKDTIDTMQRDMKKRLRESLEEPRPTGGTEAPKPAPKPTDSLQAEEQI